MAQFPKNKPFIFGVAGRDGEDMVYAFYRLVKQDHKYKVVKMKTFKA